MRKMRPLVIVMLIVTGTVAYSQKGVTQVKENMKVQEEAWNRGDLNGFMEYYWKHDSLKFIGSKGVTYGWQNTLDNYRKYFPDKKTMGILKFTLIETSQLSRDAVYVIGRFELAREKPASGHFTLLWRKIGGRWVIVSDHTS
jgi:ketosteroid isomerase-like protein